jgi:hypothetical protein
MGRRMEGRVMVKGVMEGMKVKVRWMGMGRREEEVGLRRWGRGFESRSGLMRRLLEGRLRLGGSELGV